MSEQVRTFERNHVVTEDVAIHFMGDDVPAVLASPSMISWMEYACRDNVLPLLEPGEDTVGVNVEVKHLAATPLGMKVRVVARLIKAEGRIFTFEVEAFDEHEKIGSGIHQRASVKVSKFAARVEAKKKSKQHAG